MEDKETEAVKQKEECTDPSSNEDDQSNGTKGPAAINTLRNLEEDQSQDPLPTIDQDENDSQETDIVKNDAPDNQEYIDPSSNQGISPEDTNPPKDNPPSGEGSQKETNINCDDHLTEPKVATPDGARVTLNEDSEKQPGVTAEKTSEPKVKDDEGISESAIEKQKPLSQEAPAEDQTIPETNVETIGPTPDVKSPPTSDVQPSVNDHKRRYIWIAIALVAVAILLQQLLQSRDPPQKTDHRQIDMFHQEMEKVKAQFPSQREELWKRSRIHLQRHFQITLPTEPISIILTAGVRAEGTLRCLAQRIASALSSALNASALHLDGTSKSSQDSDKVKSDIDSQLQKAFEGGKPIAVIHRFEELPPASTLIFYRYCDHENAAFKKTFLIFTVLLGEEEEIQATIRLSEVEEMVTDHLQKKFLSHGHPTAFDKMDIDKYGGLWSRISHLILPVATEKRIEKTEQC